MKRAMSAVRLAISDPRRFLGRLRNEFASPSTLIARTLRRLYYTIAPGVAQRPGRNGERLLFVYDTASSPITFDFLHYLYYANWLRMQRGKTHVDILVVSRQDLLTSREQSYVSAVGHDNMNWRLTNLLVALSRLFPAVGRVYIVEPLKAFELVQSYECVHPQGYGISNPVSAIVRLDEPGLDFRPVLRASATACEIVESYFPTADARKIVTITLRNYDYVSVRNSDVDAWVSFASSIDPAQYRVIFIPDASVHGVKTREQIKSFEVFDSACWNMELRAALYQRAWMNMGVACGPLAISGLMDKVWTVMIDRSLDYPADYLEGIGSRTGVLPGARPAFYSSTCRFYLGRDDKQTILKLFNEYQ